MVGSCLCWRNDVGSSSPAKPPHFFKIITSVGVEDQKLRVPIKFARRYGETLSNPVFLKVPNGEVWEVELKNSEGHFWLQNGWKEFKEHYSICFGHLLVFRYHGNSHFHVLIFDTSASEVEYPSRTTHGGGDDDENCQMPETKDIERDESVEIMEDFQACHTKGATNSIHDREEIGKDVSVEIFEEGLVEMESDDGEEVAFVEIPPTFPRKRKRNSVPASSDVPCRRSMRTNISRKKENASKQQDFLGDFHSTGNDTGDVKLENSDGDAKPSHLGGEIKKEFSGVMPVAQGHLQSRSRVPAKRQSKAMDRKLGFLQRAAESFKSKNPFFMVYMPPTYVYGKTNMHIPVGFAKTYLGYKKSNVTLRTADGRTWSATCNYSRMTRMATKLAWFSFARDNNINVGDVCVFEMIKSTEPLFNVVILRGAAAD